MTEHLKEETLQSLAADGGDGPGTAVLPAPVATAWAEAMARVAKLSATTLQLGVLLLAMHVFRIEQGSGLLSITWLIFAGFIVHAALPLRYRPPFFLALSFAIFWVLIGIQALVLIGLGLMLIGTCHLPIAFRWRIALLLGAGGLLAAQRGALVAWGLDPWSSPVLPILGSMFMFRLIIYLYDLRHEKGDVSVWRRLSYFFLPLNACFLLFPIVDYGTFRRADHDGDPIEIYQKGALWIFRGITHILLYRIIYYHVMPAPSSPGLVDLVLWVTSAWLIYLHVSGIFHIIVGSLCLFGFNLPPAMHLYFLSASPNDLWRRANIYWKDFMMKVFYYPVYKGLQKRKWGLTRSLVTATIVVFVATWLLHSYQWFWIVGRFPVTGVDAIFWSIFGAAVLANLLVELKRGQRLSLARRPTWSLSRSVILTGKILGMFVFVSLMWSWWSARDTGEWLSTLPSTSASASDLMILGFAVAVLLAAGVLVQYFSSRGWRLVLGSSPSYRHSMMMTSLGGLIVLLVGLPELHERMGARAAGFVVSLQSEHLNERDAGRLNWSYYDELLSETDVSIWQQRLRGGLPAEETPLWAGEEVEPTGDALYFALPPSSERATMWGNVIRTNEWGMRDKSYAREKPAGALRIALLGGSIEMGGGVEGDEVFEALLEERLNRDHAGGSYSRYEILNFAVDKYAILQKTLLAERKVFDFQPDVVLVVSYPDEIPVYLDILLRLNTSRTALPPFVEDLALRHGIRPGMDPVELRKLLLSQGMRDGSFLSELERWGHRRIAELCEQNGAIAVWVFIPTLVVGWDESLDFATMSRAPREAGFVALDASDAFGGYPPEDLSIKAKYPLPNARGHRLLADRLYELLRQHDQELGLGLGTEE